MNQKQIAKALREAAFAPGKPGPLKVIADVGNINYYTRRAMEFLTLSLTALTRDQRIKYFDNALGMVALAKVKTQDKITIGDINRAVTSPLKVANTTDILVNRKDNEVDKQNEDWVQGTGCSVPLFGVCGDVPNSERGGESKGPISEETQSRPQVAGYRAGNQTQTQH